MEPSGPELLKAALEYAGRGWSIFPVMFKNQKKRGAFRWKRYQDKAADPQRLRGWFKNSKYPGLGVILGPVSGDLACRDFDDAQAYHTWRERFADLAETLPTVKTNRGYHVYFTAKTNKTIPFMDGELRGARSLCTLPPSPHPAGTAYEWVVPLDNGPPPTLDPAESGLMGKPMQQRQTEANGGKQTQTDSNRCKLRAREVGDEVELAITATLPTGPKQRNHKIFQFVRALKGIVSLADKDPQELRGFVEQWHTRALPFIETKVFDETWIDFLWAWPRVHTPMRVNLMENAMEQARANPIPNLPYELEGVRDLVGLCRELQEIMGPEPFWLATRTAGRVLGVHHTTAWRWLFLLEQDGWIKTVQKGGTRDNPYKATRFRYTGSGRTTGQKDQ